jgi:hypothetical protein
MARKLAQRECPPDTRKADQPLKDRRAPRGTLSHWRGAATGNRIRKSVARAERVASARLLPEDFFNRRTIKQQVTRAKRQADFEVDF